ncbi:uncharacterized protein LOC133530906 [Cydia pomonella]|uniref:uncharacterized protein LOC133530906 n=1 Tax=Cydia pomonella TaxID=82600 RepID=UPI002ADE0125|nr:uncharacterized protein LOC133530906 [Cydia pomonella]
MTEHVFLHYYELSSIKDSINSIESYIGIYLDYLKSADPLYFRDTSVMTTQIFLNDLNTIYSKFNALYAVHPKQKRGLINGLGSIIKSITGNLDHNDAHHYNQAIQTLQKNQNIIGNKLNSGISINKQMLESFNITLSTIISNENKIHTTLNEIITDVNMTNYHLSDYIKINCLCNMIKSNLRNILDFVTMLENAIAFSKLGITHHSVINFENIMFMSNVLTKLYHKQEMLTNENTELRDYYDIITCGSFYTDNRIVFALKFPIMYKNTYTYYHLFPTPTLIPPKPYMAMNGEKHQYMEEECKQFQETYYCEETSFTLTSRPDDCIYSLILKHEISANCQYTAITIDFELLQKLDDYHYTMTCPQRTKSQLLCDDEEIRFIQGTYLIEVPEGCSFTTASSSVKNYRNKIKGQTIKLISFQLSNITILNNAQPLKLERVPLEQLYKLQALLEKEELQQIQPFDPKINSNLVLTVPLYVLVIATAGILVWKKLKSRRPTTTTTTTRAQDVELAPTVQPFFTGRSSE